jgi:hypothetical protein
MHVARPRGPPQLSLSYAEATTIRLKSAMAPRSGGRSAPCLLPSGTRRGRRAASLPCSRAPAGPAKSSSPAARANRRAKFAQLTASLLGRCHIPVSPSTRRSSTVLHKCGTSASGGGGRRRAIRDCRFGRIDTWVYCAGVAIYAPLTGTPAEQHQRLIQTNYFGVVHGSLTAAKHLLERGGALITVGSIASLPQSWAPIDPAFVI